MLLRYIVFCLLVLQYSTVEAASWPSKTQIKHFVVVMLENRSFDHMLGWLKAFGVNTKVNGLTGHETNPMDPSKPSETIKVSFDQLDTMGWDPSHSVGGTATEIWGGATPVNPAPMNGFLLENCGKGGTYEPHKCDAMKGYNATGVPATAFFAEQGTIFDAWHCDVPGPTQPNRMFFLSGSSDGWSTGPTVDDWIEGYWQGTLAGQCEDAGLPWKVYFSDFPVCLELMGMRDHPESVKTLDDFLADCKSGDLPAFSWVEPRWFDFGEWKENDQHPPHSTSLGEFFMAEVYEAVRASPAWNETAILFTYDEHGGLYDHVSPPDSVPNPDGKVATGGKSGPAFNFTRLGVRVPTILVSPWVNAGSIDSNLYSASSFIATMRDNFPQLTRRPLTKRDAWARPFTAALQQRTTPRTDLPATVPFPKYLANTKAMYAASQALKEQPNDVYTTPTSPATMITMSGLQRDVVNIAASLGVDRSDPDAVKKAVDDVARLGTVHEGAQYIRLRLREWMATASKASK